jgi:hypothetical protein
MMGKCHHAIISAALPLAVLPLAWQKRAKEIDSWKEEANG